MDHFANDPYNASAHAQSAASDASRAVNRNTADLDALRERVTDLENTVMDLLASLSADGIITVE